MDVRTNDEPVVLLVDDEATLLELNEVILGEIFDVITASGGEEALGLVDDSVDVVLLDRRMPELSGDEVLGRLRDRGYDTPIGMVSAVKPDRDIIELPIDDYLTKPIDSEELRRRTELLAIRTEFDQPCREFFRLASKRSALEIEDGLKTDNSKAVQELITRMDTLREDIESQITHPNAGDLTDVHQLNTLSDRIRDVCHSLE